MQILIKVILIGLLTFSPVNVFAQHFRVTNEGQHPLRHRGEKIVLDTTNFDSNLSSADDNVQAALETLDELSTSTPEADTLDTVSDRGATTNQEITTGGLIVGSDQTVGLGSGKALIKFTDAATDNINLIDANVGIGTSSPHASAAATIVKSFGSVNDPSNGSATLNAGAGASLFYATNTVQYRIYAYSTVAGTTIYSPNYTETNEVTILNDGDTVSVAWDIASGAEGYLVIQNINGVGFDDYYLTIGIDDFTDDNGYDLVAWSFGTPTYSPTYVTMTTYLNHMPGSQYYTLRADDGGWIYMPSGSSNIVVGGKVGINNIAPSAKLDIVDTDGTATILKMKTSEHSSAGANEFSLYDSGDREVAGMAAWNGGGGPTGYGAMVLSSHCTGAGCRMGELSSKNTVNSYRLSDIIFETDSAADNGRTYLLNGVGSGAFRYAWYCSNTGRCSFNGGTTTTLTTPSAVLHLRAGTTTAGYAPLKFTSGSLLSAAEAGAVEFLTDKWYGTITTGTARKEFTMNDAALTSGRVPFATTNGRLTDDSDMTFATDTLTATKIVGSTSITNSSLTSGRVVISSTSGLQSDDADLTFSTDTLTATGLKVGATKLSQYNSINTVSNGIPTEYATIDLTGQTAAIGATTIYAVPAAGAGMYRVSFVAKVTTAATTSSTLGGAGGFQVIYTDQNDSVSVTTGAILNQANATLTGNTTQIVYSGSVFINAKASTNIQYQFGYTSSGATPMAYNMHIKLEAL